VYVESRARILTQGANAHGIFAQSVSEGGGVWDNGTGMVAGTSSKTGPIMWGEGTVSVNVAGSVTVEGAGSWGIYAQDVNRSAVDAPVSITVGGAVRAEGASAGAVKMSSYTGGNKLAIASGGVVQGNVMNDASSYNGDIVTASAGPAAATTPVTRSTTVGAAASSAAVVSTGSLVNEGTLITRDYVTGLDVTNNGAINLGGTGTFGKTTFSGNLVGRGTIGHLDVDLANGRADQLIVEGATSGSQKLDLNPFSLAKGGEARFLKTLGTDDVSLSVAKGSLFSFDLDEASGWHTVRVTDADFTGFASGFGQNARAAATTLQDAWATSKSSGVEDPEISLGRVFAQFHDVEGSELNSRLLAVQSFASTLGGTRAAQNGIAAANDVMSCPAFEGDGVMITEGRCVWLKGVGGRLERQSSGDQPGYDTNSTSLSLGGQAEVAPDWFLGGNISHTDYSTNFSNGTESVSGNALTMAVSLKRQVGQWIFSGALGGGTDDADSTRHITLGDLTAKAEGSPDSNLLFARARVAYEIPFDKWYLRPTLDLDLVNFRQDSYSETGAGDLNLKVDSVNETYFAATPAMEAGARFDYGAGNVLRLYGVAGVSFLNQDSFTASARLVGAPGAELLDTNSSVDDVVGRFGINFDLLTAAGLELRLGYGLTAGSDVTDQTGQIRFGYRF
jgi:uncharacterized protein with beta-barrel porin domain